jgi:hypothetical protein
MWASKTHPFSDEQWNVARMTMISAVINNPTNTQHYFDLARLYEWKANQYSVWEQGAINNRDKAIQWYKKSLQYRPTWSSAWVNLALSKTLNMEFDDEVITALSNTVKYGVWEKNVFQKLLWVSISNWERLPLTLQDKVKSLISRSIHDGNVPDYIRVIATVFKWQDTLEDIINSYR